MSFVTWPALKCHSALFSCCLWASALHFPVETSTVSPSPIPVWVSCRKLVHIYPELHFWPAHLTSQSKLVFPSHSVFIWFSLPSKLFWLQCVFRCLLNVSLPDSSRNSLTIEQLGSWLFWFTINFSRTGRVSENRRHLINTDMNE